MVHARDWLELIVKREHPRKCVPIRKQDETNIPATENRRSKKKPDTGNPAAHALARYRCFLPDLAGLAGLRRAGPMPDQPIVSVASRK